MKPRESNGEDQLRSVFWRI